MFCMHCGQQLPPDAFFCPNCGQKAESSSNEPAEDTAVSAQPPQKKDNVAGGINSYMGFAVVMAVLGCLCCTPVTLAHGLIAVVFASQVSGYAASGNYMMAAKKALMARVFCWIAFGFLAAYVFAFAAMIFYSGEISEFLREKFNLEYEADENDESAEPDRHHSNYSLLWDLLD